MSEPIDDIDRDDYPFPPEDADDFEFFGEDDEELEDEPDESDPGIW